MTNETYLGLILLATFSPIVLFGLVALLATPPAQSSASFEDEYMLAGRGIKSSDFVNSATGYMLQVSTTFYFIYWGYNYGFSNTFYLLSWAIGIALFASFAPRLLEFRIKHKSLPQFLSDGERNKGRSLAAIATVASFIGVFYVESYFTANFITNIASANTVTEGNAVVWWVIFSSLTILVLLYSISGGLRKVIVTDTWQLAGAYFGLAIVFAYLLQVTLRVDVTTGIILSILCLIIYLSLLVAGRNTNEGVIKPGALIVGVVIFVFLTIKGITSYSSTSSSINIYGLFKQVSEPWGWVTLLGFTVINIAWQFCDNSNYQRIGALSLPDDKQKAEKELKRSIQQLIIVSPLTWGLGIVFGMLIRSAAISVSAPGSEYQAIVDLLKQDALSGSFLAIGVLFALIASLISIMMSTCDTALIAAVQVAHKDLQKKFTLNKWFLAITALLFISLVAGLAFVHKITGNTSILTVMAGVYSAILVLFPISLSVMLSRKVTQLQTVAAISLGLAANFYATFLAPSGIPFNVAIVLPIFAGLGGSLIGFFVFRRKAIAV